MENNEVFHFIGRPDGLGNRIEELINIQEFCETNNKKCVYIWNNSQARKYDIFIHFDNIKIQKTFIEEEKKKFLKNCFLRSYEYIVKYQFNFNTKINNNINYDAIIHIRATDRLVTNPHHNNYSTELHLVNLMNKTIDYINNDDSIKTYTIVTDDIHRKNIKSRINKKYVELLYDYDIHKDYLDFYYLINPSKYVLMCSQFSSYSITASILGNKPLLVFKTSLNSNLPRYKANIKIID